MGVELRHSSGYNDLSIEETGQWPDGIAVGRRREMGIEPSDSDSDS